MRSFFWKAVTGASLLFLVVTSAQCAFYNESMGRDEAIRYPVKKIARAPLEAKPEVVTEGIDESYQRGLLAMERGDPSQAIEAFLSVFSRDPSYGEVRKKLVQVYRLKQREQAQEKRAEAETVEYTVGLGDILSVSVWQWPDLDMPNVIVRPDGKISFPLVGDITAEGLTLTELDNILTAKLREFIKDPEVSVSISQFGGRKVIVLGEVSSQGVYAPTGRTSVLEVIALAGGFRPSAVSSSVVLIRQLPDRNLFYRLDIRNALRYGNMRENIEIESDDIIFVPRRFVNNVGDFVGQVTPWIGSILTTNAMLKDYDVME